MKKRQKMLDKQKKQISKYQKRNPKKRCKRCGAFLKKVENKLICIRDHSKMEYPRIYKGYCKNCGKYYEGRGKDYCSRKCVGQVYSPFRKGKLHPYFGKKPHNWKGGKYLTSPGYIMIHKPKHPNATHLGYIQEHRFVMEEHIGRYLTEIERVHHLDGDKANNRIENLYLFPNESKHQKYHYFLKECIRNYLEAET